MIWVVSSQVRGRSCDYLQTFSIGGVVASLMNFKYLPKHSEYVPQNAPILLLSVLRHIFLLPNIPTLGIIGQAGKALSCQALLPIFDTFSKSGHKLVKNSLRICIFV